MLILLILLANGAQAADSYRPLVHGHRGARSAFPENTIPAFEHALVVGADYLELDLGITKDNVPVLSHERRINPHICKGALAEQTTEPPLLKDLTVKQIKTLDCGGKKNPRFPDQKLKPGARMPTLDEFFYFVKNQKGKKAKNIQFNIETKIDPAFPNDTVSPEDFALLVYKVIKKHQVSARTVVQSFDFRTLVEFKKIDPSLRTSALIEDPKLDWAEVIKSLQPWAISPEQDLLTQERVDLLKTQNIKIVPWTANTPDAWNRLLDFKVDAIITDDPKKLIEHLDN